MKLQKMIATLLLTLFGCYLPVAAQEDQTRGGWLESRGRLEKREKAATPAPKTSNKPKPASPNTSTPSVQPEQAAATSGLGIGYTLFKKNINGEFVRVSTDERFKSGDSVRLLVETNLDGYLYIFSRENGKAPMLLFPNAHVQSGNNYLKAHKAFWLPEEGEIEFDGNPAEETLTLLFSERPLPHFVPSPSLDGVAVDAKLYDEVARETEVNRIGNLNVGIKLTAEEGTRSVRIRKSSPPPAYILVNRDTKTPRIVANIKLTHH